MQLPKYLLPPARRSYDAVKPIFILSHGRAGTMWLARVIQSMFPNVISVHEPPPMVKVLALEYHYGNISSEIAVQGLLQARKSHISATIKKFKALYYIEINRNLFSLAIPLRTAFPRAKIYGLIRNGRDFLVSMLNKNFYGKRLAPGLGGGKPYLESQESWWESASQVEKISWHWITKINSFKDQVDALFKIEDLKTKAGFENFIKQVFGSSNKNVQRMYTHLSQQKINRGTKWKIALYSDLSRSDKDAFNRIAGKTMEELGYY